MASGSRIRRTGATDTGTGSKDNDFLKHISIDLSSLELRFEQIFARIEALETRQEELAPLAPCSGDDESHLASQRAHSQLAAAHVVTPTSASGSTSPLSESVTGASSNTTHGDSDSNNNNSSSSSGKVVDLSGLTKEIESLRAAQLRLKIDHELAQSTLKVELETVRRDLELMPQQSDLASFRAELDVLLTTSLRAAQTQHAALEHALHLSLAAREVAENQWKSVFEDTIAARIQDVWSGLHSTSRKLQETMQFLQTEFIKHGDSTRETSDIVEDVKNNTAALVRDSLAHAAALSDQHKGIEHLFALCAQSDARVAAHETASASHMTALTERMEATESRLNATQRRHDALTHDVETTLKNVVSDVVSCQSSLAAHQESLHSLDGGVTRQSAELMRLHDAVMRSDTKLGGLDGRVAMGEKKTATIAAVVSEHHQELQHHMSTLTAGLDQAAAERGAIKRTSADLQYSISETQQKLSEVAKMAMTTDLALARTAAEIPKLHVLVSTTAANVAKNRQTLRDVTVLLNDEKLFAQTLQSKFESEVALSVMRFGDVATRIDVTQQAVADAQDTTQNIKHALEDAIRYNSNMIHQLNTMVDSIVITESADGMEDKLARFALSVAELGLKLEHFRRSSSSGTSINGVKENVKGELAVLLTKVIRFLGSGVSIDQNKYLLTAKRQTSVDPATGALIVEQPPQQVLEHFRTAKASLFCSRTRTYMDELQPVLASNKHTIEFRDSFARKLQFVLEFGLANLFPNLGRPKNPQSKRTGTFGTCIACDRPIDDDQLEYQQQQPQYDDASGIGAMHRSCSGVDGHDAPGAVGAASLADDLVTEEHRLRRQRIVTSAGTGASSANRIDTKSVIRGRSGNSGLRPKSSAEPVHHAPGTADYIYRAGFRLPKPSGLSANQTATPNKSASAAALLLSGVIANAQQLTDLGDASTNDLIDDGSSLERTALVGRNQQQQPPPVEVPNVMLGLAATTRPHTAPFRTKSLPRLEGVVTAAAPSASSPSVVATARGEPQRVVGS